ncbi:hypothetical protein C7M84_001193 [Penaeus vannamei]|uniref:Uncharacterized protein n=1 Tax=Penaeus vannamei TaxID=6689 RepID=A0A423TUJ0_PENVA|nr:hypothetical protein C7M84_001193 [Penaeus vannamei]
MTFGRASVTASSPGGTREKWCGTAASGAGGGRRWAADKGFACGRPRVWALGNGRSGWRPPSLIPSLTAISRLTALTKHLLQILSLCLIRHFLLVLFPFSTSLADQISISPSSLLLLSPFRLPLLCSFPLLLSSLLSPSILLFVLSFPPFVFCIPPFFSFPLPPASPFSTFSSFLSSPFFFQFPPPILREIAVLPDRERSFTAIVPPAALFCGTVSPRTSTFRLPRPSQLGGSFSPLIVGNGGTISFPHLSSLLFFIAPSLSIHLLLPPNRLTVNSSLSKSPLFSDLHPHHLSALLRYPFLYHAILHLFPSSNRSLTSSFCVSSTSLFLFSDFFPSPLLLTSSRVSLSPSSTSLFLFSDFSFASPPYLITRLPFFTSSPPSSYFPIFPSPLLLPHHAFHLFLLRPLPLPIFRFFLRLSSLPHHASPFLLLHLPLPIFRFFLRLSSSPHHASPYHLLPPLPFLLLPPPSSYFPIFSFASLLTSSRVSLSLVHLPLLFSDFFPSPLLLNLITRLTSLLLPSLFHFPIFFLRLSSLPHTRLPFPFVHLSSSYFPIFSFAFSSLTSSPRLPFSFVTSSLFSDFPSPLLLTSSRVSLSPSPSPPLSYFPIFLRLSSLPHHASPFLLFVHLFLFSDFSFASPPYLITRLPITFFHLFPFSFFPPHSFYFRFFLRLSSLTHHASPFLLRPPPSSYFRFFLRLSFSPHHAPPYHLLHLFPFSPSSCFPIFPSPLLLTSSRVSLSPSSTSSFLLLPPLPLPIFRFFLRLSPHLITRLPFSFFTSFSYFRFFLRLSSLPHHASPFLLRPPPSSYFPIFPSPLLLASSRVSLSPPPLFPFSSSYFPIFPSPLPLTSSRVSLSPSSTSSSTSSSSPRVRSRNIIHREKMQVTGYFRLLLCVLKSAEDHGRSRGVNHVFAAQEVDARAEGVGGGSPRDEPREIRIFSCDGPSSTACERTLLCKRR